MARGTASGESGFTLAEVLIAVAILGIIAAAIGAAFFVTAHNSIGVDARFQESHDAQVASAYLATDVQGAVAIVASPCVGGNVISLSQSNGTTVSYSYGSTLTRSICSGATIQSAVVLVHNGGGTPTVTCFADCNVGTKPSKVKISISEHNPSSGANDYTYSLTGATRSQTSGASGTTTAYPALLALGSNGVQITLNGGHPTLQVNGTIIVNSSSHPAVTSHSANFSYSQLQIVGTGTCDSCSYVNRTEPVPDPFAGLPAPNTSGPGSDHSPYSPGIYTDTFSPNGTLSPGVYVLQDGLSMSGHDTATGAGVLFYITGGSVSISGQATLIITPPTTGTYAGISIWQAVTDTSAFSISGNGAVSVGGVLYLPGASSVTLGTGNGDLDVRSVIAPNIIVSGNGNVTIGP